MFDATIEIVHEGSESFQCIIIFKSSMINYINYNCTKKTTRFRCESIQLLINIFLDFLVLSTDKFLSSPSSMN